MIHETKLPNTKIIIMLCEPKIKGEQEIKVNSKGVDINEEDYLSVGSIENPGYYIIHKIVEKRKASLHGWTYHTMIATRTNKTL